MKLIQLLYPLALAGVLAGCAAGPQKSDAHAHSGHSGMGMMNIQAMCERHKKMMSGKSPAEQQAMMKEHMKSMPPEMHQRMHAMHEQCR